MESKTLIITGMHRSGTSLVTQWLFKCGLNVGQRLLKESTGNVEGHFEDSDFLNLHEKLLVKRRLPVTGFTDEPVALLTNGEMHQLKRLIEVKSESSIEWGWKEPRTCLFLFAYNKLIPRGYYLVVVRDYNSTVNSMLAREYKVQEKKFNSKKGLSRIKWILFKRMSAQSLYARYAETFLRVWINYYQEILEHVIQLPLKRYRFVYYSMLVENDKDIFDMITQRWGFELHYIPFSDVYKGQLMSEATDISLYIKDKHLIRQAKKIEQAVKALLVK